LRIRVLKGFWTSTPGLAFLSLLLLGFLSGTGLFAYYSIKFSKMIDERLAAGILQNTTQIFSTPTRIFPGQTLSQEELISYLQRAGYRTKEDEATLGQYTVRGNAVEVRPGKASYFVGKNAVQVQFAGSAIRSVRTIKGTELPGADIEPELISNLFDSSREKRRYVRYEDLPQVMVNALLSAEDKRFFEHPGFDPVRILGAAWADLRGRTHLQGASTLTMQVARSFFFSTERTLRRKLAETMVALKLEQRFSKKEIFELYANEIYLGNRGSFAIHGFAQASLAYFGKDIRQLTPGEAAFLAGIIRAPNYYSSADRRPERGVQARDRVLTQMAENGYLTAGEVQQAQKTALQIIRNTSSGSEAPYFADMVKDHLLEKFSESDLLSQNFRVYTTLDLNLQRAAVAAVEAGMKNVDDLVAKKYAASGKPKKKGAGETLPQAQVALVALDPRTGEIRALVGGRNYGMSQLNHALSRRQPGSSFKPFVYAAAFEGTAKGLLPVVTPATPLVDEETTFEFDGKEYTPNNFGEKFMGPVTVRDALINSLNVATIKVGQMIGFDRVVAVARQMDLGNNIQATPAVALGAYEMTPVDVAAGYTAFANGGTRAEPKFLHSVVSASGETIEKFPPQTSSVLDPRAAFLVTSMLKDVLNRGTGAGVRAMGFTQPAAGKTGTSRDGWFAGFTSNLLCVIWIGFDDNHDLGLTGGSTAAPIWGDFMMRAAAMPGYSDVHDFTPPEGVVTVSIDSDTLQLATALCPAKRDEVYIAGTAPTDYCGKHGGAPLETLPPSNPLSHVFGAPPKTEANPAVPPAGNPPVPPAGSSKPPAPGGAAHPPVR
jgi:penicillin-binding protein 1B